MIPNDQLKKKNSHKNKSECTVVGLGPLLPSIKCVHLYVNLIGELKKIGKLKKNCHKNKSECTVVGLGPLLPSIKRVHLYVKFNRWTETKWKKKQMNVIRMTRGQN